MKHTFDLIMSLSALILLTIPMLMVAILVKLTSSGPVLYWSDRIGRNNLIFKMPKFRTMRTDTPAVATHAAGYQANRLISWQADMLTCPGLTGWAQINGRPPRRFEDKR